MSQEFKTTCKDVGTIKGCGKQILMKKDDAGKWHPFNLDNTPHKHEEPKPTPTTKGLEHYYSGIVDIEEVDLVGAKELLKQGWTLEKIDMKHAFVETPSGFMQESTWSYVFSRRTS